MLLRQVGLTMESKYVRPDDGTQPYRRRKITDESWQAVQMYVSYRESLKSIREEALSQQQGAAVPSPVSDTPLITSLRKSEGGDQETLDLADTLVTAMQAGKDAVLSAWEKWKPDRRAEVLSELQETVLERFLGFIPDLFLWCSG